MIVEPTRPRLAFAFIRASAAWPERFALVASLAALALYGTYVVLAIVTDPGEPLTAGDWRNMVVWGVEFVGGVSVAAWAVFRLVALVLRGRA